MLFFRIYMFIPKLVTKVCIDFGNIKYFNKVFN